MKKTFISIFITFTLIFGTLFVMANDLTYATPAQPAPAATGGGCQTGSFFGLPTWYKYLTLDSTNCDPIILSSADLPKSVALIALAVLEMLLTLAGVIAVFMVVMGGFKYVTSQGEPDKIANAKDTLLNAVTGAMIAILASQIVSYIAQKFKGGGSDQYGLVKLQADQGVLGDVLGIIYVIIGAISVFMVVYAGFKFVISGNDPQKVAQARKTIYYALIGLAVTIFASVLTSYILGKLT